MFTDYVTKYAEVLNHAQQETEKERTTQYHPSKKPFNFWGMLLKKDGYCTSGGCFLWKHARDRPQKTYVANFDDMSINTLRALPNTPQNYLHW